MGSDTMAGIRWVNHYYREPMAGFSVPASEHSIECSYGPNNENEYLEKVLDTYAKPGSIVSIVIDGYDVYRAAEALCTKFKEKIIGSKAKVVFRPDSGDINTVVLRLLALQESVFGYDLTSSGYKKIRHVGVIQGDGVNQEAIISLFEKMIKDGYSVDNVVFGSGGAMLQGINRDTLKFAQKACAILRSSDNEWQPIFKDPITDSGKKSKAGYLSLFKDRVTGEIMTMVNKDVNPEYYSEVLQVVYENGTVKNLTTLSEVRERCKI